MNIFQKPGNVEYHYLNHGEQLLSSGRTAGWKQIPNLKKISRQHQGEAFTSVWQGEKYPTLFAVNRIMRIFLATMITIAMTIATGPLVAAVTLGLLTVSFQGVRDLITGRKVCIILERDQKAPAPNPEPPAPNPSKPINPDVDANPNVDANIDPDVDVNIDPDVDVNIDPDVDVNIDPDVDNDPQFQDDDLSFEALENRFPFPKVSSIPPLLDEIKKAIKKIKPIDKKFTTLNTIEEQREAHQNGCDFLKENLEQVGGIAAPFSPPQMDIPNLDDVQIKTDLDPDVVKFEYTEGVFHDVKKAGLRKGKGNVGFTVCSQLNWCESPGRYTVEPRKAWKTYIEDGTQGPAAQLAFSREQVELINAAGNLGTNALSNVLDEDTKAEIKHGYFTPSQDKAEKIIDQLKTNGHKIEYLSVGNIPTGTDRIVYQFLVAAPAFGAMYSLEDTVKGKDNAEIQFICALHSFRAQFEKAIEIAKDTKEPFTLKLGAVGLGVFGNDSKIVAKAFSQAISEYQQLLKDNNVKIIVQQFRPKDSKTSLHNLLNLTEHTE